MKVGQKIKKLSAWLLTFAMLIGFVPAGLVMSSQATVTWAGAAATTVYNLPKLSGIEDWANFASGYTSSKQIVAPSGSGVWYYGGEHSAKSLQVDKNNRIVFRENAGDGNFYTFTLVLPTTVGRYTVKMESVYAGNSVAGLNVWKMSPETTAASGMTSANLIGTYNPEDPNKLGEAGTNKSSTYQTVGVLDVTTETAGKPLKFVVKATDAASAMRYAQYFYGVKLDGAQPPELSSVALTASKTTLVEGESAILSVLGTMNNDAAADLTAATVEITNLTPDYVDYDATTKTATWKALGTAKLKVTVTLGAITKTDELEITCTEILTHPGAEHSVKYNFITGFANKDDHTKLTEYGAKNENWKYYAMGADGSSFKAFYTNSARFSVPESATPADGWLALTVKAPKKGRYGAHFTFSNHVGADSLDMYVLPANTAPADITAALTNTAPVMQNVPFQQNTGAITVKVGQVDFYSAEDEALFVFRANKRGTVQNSGVNSLGLSLCEVALDGEAPSPLDVINFTLSNNTVSESTPAKILLSAKLKNGANADLSPANLAEVTYESSDENVAVVDEASGEIRAVSNGNARITVTIKLDGITKTAYQDVVCVSYGGESTTNEINLMNGLLDDGENVEALTSYDPDKNVRWAYFGNYMNISDRSYTKNGAVSFIGMDADAWTALKFKSADAGAYNLKLAYKNHVGATGAKVFVIPASTALADINDIITNVAPIGSFTYEEGSEEKTVSLGEVPLQANTEYILVIQATGKGSDGAAGYATLTATKIIFDGVKPAPEAPKLSAVSIELLEKLALNGSYVATVSGTMTDGSAADLTGATIAWASDDAAVEINATTGALVAKSIGNATITATVTLGAVTTSDTHEVEVITPQTDLERPGEQYVTTYDFRKSYGLANAAGGYPNANQDFKKNMNLTISRAAESYDANTNPNWKIVSSSTSPLASYQWIKYTAKNENAYNAYIIKLPEQAGSYGVSFTYRGRYGVPSVNMWAIPADTTDIAAALTNENLIGTATLDIKLSNNASTYFTTGVGEIEVQPYEVGTERMIVIKAAEKANENSEVASGGVGDYGFYYRSITLDGTKPLDSLTLTMDKGTTTANVIGVGETATIIATTPKNPSEATEATIVYSSLDESIATVDATTGVVTGVNSGLATIKATATLGEHSKSTELQIVVGTIKTRSSVYDAEKVANARENIKTYSWATSTMKSAVAAADKYVGRAEEIYSLITSQELPRGQWWRNDPNYRICRYCGEDIMTKYSTGYNGWLIDPLDVAWKVQCPDCRRYFPSNDFGKYYELGIDPTTGKYNPALAKQKNDELVANGEDGYLKNILYPEKDEYVDKDGVVHNVGVHNWGVDNGYGYDTGNYYTGEYSSIKEIHVYIPLYNTLGVWFGTWSYNGGGLIPRSLNALKDAYIYTGEEKYGYAGAIIVDRVADVYHEMNLKTEWKDYINSDGGSGVGQVVGRIGDYTVAVNLAQAYDAFWPAMADESVINFLSEQAAKYNLPNTKTSAELIRYNADNGILRGIREGLHYRRVWGNTGYPQMAMAYAAVALDTFPETAEWIDWIFAPSKSGINGQTGNYYTEMIDSVCRDGWGDEGSPGYNVGWMNSFSTVADILLDYGDTYSAGNLYEYPKYMHAIKGISKLTLASRYYPHIGDAGEFAKKGNLARTTLLTSAWKAGIKDENVARLLYFLVDGDMKGINTGIFSKNPESIQEEVKAVIAEKGAMVSHPSMNLAGYGLMMTRDGEWKQGNQNIDTQRSFWMYYGRNTGHGHFDTLNLGVIAYGLDLAPDNGNPDFKTVEVNRITWAQTPMAHNTVFVVEKPGENYTSAVVNSIITGDPYHFDDSGKVKVMDVDAPEVYDSTEIFRRTVVSVDASNDVSYAVDFFRVRGGNDHIYNFHAQGDEVEVDIPMVEQPKLTVDSKGNPVESSYAGPDVPYGTDPLWANAWTTPLKSPAGFTWIKNVYRAANPTASVINADFKITDYHDILPGDPDLHLKLTMLNTNGELTEFAYGDQRPPKSDNSPALIKQIMARRQGKNLDSLFTAVIQPYKDNPYILSVEDVPLAIKSGYEGKLDAARAVKVTLVGGRTDYVVYATNNNVAYTIDNKFDFQGFVGVVTYEDGVATPIYTYMNDGVELAGMTGTAAYTGKIVDFTKEVAHNNIITVEFNGDYDVNNLAGNYIYIDNGGYQNAEKNGAYLIESAVKNGNKVELNVGSVTTIHSYVDATDASKGYNYLMTEGDSFRIPLPTYNDASPIVNELPEQTVEAGNTLTFKVTATSQTGNPLSYKMKDSVAGMKFDEATQTFSWTPTSANRGDNFVSFVVSDGLLESILYVDIKVANATGGSIAGGDTIPSGGGGGGGSSDDKPNTDDKEEEPKPEDPGVTPGGDTGKKFVDLGAHSWAEDAIYELVDAGVINGTSANTYSPANNITRADFATLAVRLFKFTGEVETFADVPSDKYYAEPVGIAKNVGVVNGISETEFAPLREISREDMMVMLYRALKVAGIELEETVELTHSDFDEVSDYAKEAVSALIKSGLIAGSNGKINPKGKATRAEVAVVLNRINALLK